MIVMPHPATPILPNIDCGFHNKCARCQMRWRFRVRKDHPESTVKAYTALALMFFKDGTRRWLCRHCRVKWDYLLHACQPITFSEVELDDETPSDCGENEEEILKSDAEEDNHTITSCSG